MIYKFRLINLICVLCFMWIDNFFLKCLVEMFSEVCEFFVIGLIEFVCSLDE